MAPRVPRSAPAAAPRTDHNPKAEKGDNSAAELEAERIQLISFVSKLTAADSKIAEAKAPFEAAKKARRQVVNLAKAAGFTAEELEARMEEMNNPQRDNPLRIARESRHRLWLGIVRPEQTELQLGDKVPSEAKDEAHWKGEGYKAGLRQMERKPPPECAERFVQPWLGEYDRGLKEVLIANAPISAAQRQKAVADQAKADFAKDNPEVDVAAEAKRLANDPKFMAKGAGEIVDPDSLSVGAEAQGQASGADAPFEATPEELDAQPGRRAIQERREAEQGPGEGDAVV